MKQSEAPLDEPSTRCNLTRPALACHVNNAPYDLNFSVSCLFKHISYRIDGPVMLCGKSKNTLKVVSSPFSISSFVDILNKKLMLS